jgi:hypothetical protein
MPIFSISFVFGLWVLLGLGINEYLRFIATDLIIAGIILEPAGTRGA